MCAYLWSSVRNFVFLNPVKHPVEARASRFNGWSQRRDSMVGISRLSFPAFPRQAAGCDFGSERLGSSYLTRYPSFPPPPPRALPPSQLDVCTLPVPPPPTLIKLPPFAPPLSLSNRYPVNPHPFSTSSPSGIPASTRYISSLPPA